MTLKSDIDEARSEIRTDFAVLSNKLDSYTALVVKDIADIVDDYDFTWGTQNWLVNDIRRRYGLPTVASRAAEERSTAAEMRLHAPMEKYIRDLKWSADTPDHVRTVVAGNIRGCFGFLLAEGLLKMNVKP